MLHIFCLQAPGSFIHHGHPSGMRVFLVTLGNVNTKEGNHGNRGNQQKEIFSVCSLVWQYFKLCPSRMSNVEKSWCLGVVDPSSGSVCLVKYFPQRISSIG
jgi:hypothetical protein